MRPLIFTADDFGFSEEINEAVERGHREGVLGAASLMVTGPAAADAIARARRLPGLRVGLHLVLVQGKPASPPDSIPALVDGRGRFHDNLAKAGVIWFFHPQARRQLRREIAAQIAAFKATGLRLDHVNGHNHMQVHPTVFGELIRQLKAEPKIGLRLPREPWSVTIENSPLMTRTTSALRWLIMTPFLGLMRRQLLRNGISHNEWLLGIKDSGRLNEGRLLGLLDRLPTGVSEIHCHPATRRTAAIAESMPGYDNEAELAALLSPRIGEALARRGLRVGGFLDIRDEAP
ncbi:hopanoid biosynthesis-associated protein HpnK [Rhodoligotrophos defluvii]|uniref:hopanoid biosynthesis-associated protein HpnK n=1 Tax=Rhodoligotrophos defluvii TaxID=2561934 RepID=UPI0010CA03E8|nr:hopanoid biosynthesis-associated protein HpnK [Rhodoligotrophos defluvii]